MTIDLFKEIMQCNEPDFLYNGELYSICCPMDKYYVIASDSPSDVDLEFNTLDDLLNNWIIQGQPLCDILQDIELG